MNEHHEAETPRPAAEWNALAQAAEKDVDYLGATDYALMGLEQHDADRALQYRAILNLSRAGAARRARQLWEKYGLAAMVDDPRQAQELAERIASLGARLEREDAFAAPASGRGLLLRSAASRYEAIYARTHGTFPGVNAAVLYELGGSPERARQIAEDVLAACARVTPRSVNEAFQLAADRAAAALLAEDMPVARTVIEDAAKLGKGVNLASTRRQLLQICEHRRLDTAIRAGLRNGAVIHYTGHMIAPEGAQGRFPAVEGERVAAEIDDVLRHRNVGYGHGSLACGADLLVAQALLGRGGVVDAVVPFETMSFRQESVQAGGPAWLTCFDHVLPQVGVTHATDGRYAGDPAVFAYASRLAMGMALLRANALGSEVFQLAVWDGRTTDRPAGTFVDIDTWRRLGLETRIIDSRGTSPDVSVRPQQRPSELPPRLLRAIMFGDFKGFSRLNDEQMLVFFEHVMSTVAEVLDRYADHVLIRNTWGDGLYFVLDDLPAAARCGLEIQAALADLDLAALGLPRDLSLRLGVHAGAVFEVRDPVLRAQGFTGNHISRTARLEPVTPPGEVYVTEAFAALLALERQPDLACDYVGRMPAAKGYGRLRMYLLRWLGR